MALNPVPIVATDSGDAADAPEGAIPVAAYGFGGGGGGNEVTLDGDQAITGRKTFTRAVTVGSPISGETLSSVDPGAISLISDFGKPGQKSVQILAGPGSGTVMLVAPDPAGGDVGGIIVAANGSPPATGTFVLQSVNGIVSWVAGP